MKNEPSGEYYDYTKTMKPERPWLLQYHQSLVYFMMLATRGGDGEMDNLFLTFEQVLDAIKKVNNLSCGIPQVVYIIGWHHEGHDSKYPHWNEANRHLKRDCDETALDSLRWLIREARKYNAIVSLHLNMMDAYPDSPLWDEYVEKDIIAKDKEGNIIKGKEWGGMASYQMSYTQEWKTGMAQKRIDGIIEMIPELIEGKTIHIDAFLGARPLEREAPISPYLGYTKDEEMATQRKIYRYWRDRGIDVTSEWVNGFRDDRFVGLQAWAWHAGNAIDDLPDELYCTNVMEDSREFRGDPASEQHKAYPSGFFLKVLPWYYKNNPNGSEKTEEMIDGTDICMPALWCNEPTILAYSQEGYQNKSWKLPESWKDVKEVTISKLTFCGVEEISDQSVTDGQLSLELGKDESLKIVPKV